MMSLTKAWAKPNAPKQNLTKDSKWIGSTANPKRRALVSEQLRATLNLQTSLKKEMLKAKTARISSSLQTQLAGEGCFCILKLKCHRCAIQLSLSRASPSC